MRVPIRRLAGFSLCVALAGCDPFAPIAGYAYKECRHALQKLPHYTELTGGARLQFIHRCMLAKGLSPSKKCQDAQAQGRPHCAYYATSP